MLHQTCWMGMFLFVYRFSSTELTSATTIIVLTCDPSLIFLSTEMRSSAMLASKPTLWVLKMVWCPFKFSISLQLSPFPPSPIPPLIPSLPPLSLPPSPSLLPSLPLSPSLPPLSQVGDLYICRIQYSDFALSATVIYSLSLVTRYHKKAKIGLADRLVWHAKYRLLNGLPCTN